MPLALPGNIIRDLEVRFEGGRIVDVTASSGEDYVRAQIATDEGAARLGEVALVDGTSRVGADRAHLLQHALRRERDLPHRVRPRHRVLRRGLGGTSGGQTARGRRQPVERPHRLHDRRAGGRRRRHHAGRRRSPDHPQQRLAVGVTLALSGTTWLDVVLTMSIVVPLAVLGGVIYLFFRSARRADQQGRG